MPTKEHNVLADASMHEAETHASAGHHKEMWSALNEAQKHAANHAKSLAESGEHNASLAYRKMTMGRVSHIARGLKKSIDEFHMSKYSALNAVWECMKAQKPGWQRLRYAIPQIELSKTSSDIDRVLGQYGLALKKSDEEETLEKGDKKQHEEAMYHHLQRFVQNAFSPAGQKHSDMAWTHRTIGRIGSKVSHEMWDRANKNPVNVKTFEPHPNDNILPSHLKISKGMSDRMPAYTAHVASSPHKDTHQLDQIDWVDHGHPLHRQHSKIKQFTYETLHAGLAHHLSEETDAKGNKITIMSSWKPKNTQKSEGLEKVYHSSEADETDEWEARATKNRDAHLDSAVHMGGHKLHRFDSYNITDSADHQDMAQHIMDAAKLGHKIHATYHKNNDTINVSSWKPKAK